MNIFKNFVKRSLVERKIKGRVGALGGVGALLLLALDITPASSSCFLEISAGKMTQGLCQVVQDPGAIAIKSLNVIFLNGLADLLGMELLEM